jgi:thiol-disulfide isomerase/thioredoxin
VSRTVFVFAAFCWINLASFVGAGDSILINFTSAHCGPCRLMQPLLQSLEDDGLPIRHVDVQREPDLAVRYSIRQTPTFVIMNEGREVTRLVGSQTADQLRRAVALNGAGPITHTRSHVSDNRLAANQPAGHAPAPAARTRLAAIERDNRFVPQDAADSNFPPATLGDVSSPEGSSPPTVLSEAMPSQAAADAVERAQAATVRLRVHDGHGYGAGTGTIIDTHGEEALVLTCGHLFRETGKQGRIDVDLFVAGQTKTVTGQLIDFDAEDRDIALVAIRPGFAVTPTSIASPDERQQVGQSVFSFGCDRGDDPSRRDTRITGIDKYNQHMKASNIEIGDAPIDGRSGGGLFDAEGRLLGVCNAADYKNNVGIYAGPGAIAWQLERVSLTRLLESKSPRQEPMPDRLASLESSPPAMTAQPSFTANEDLQLASENIESGSEVIVIIRDKTTGKDRVVTMNHPTDEFMQMIQR